MSGNPTLFNGPMGCDFRPIDGNVISAATTQKSGPLTMSATRVGAGFDMHDSAGDLYTPLATESGYRLTCAKFPAHSTIHAVFAVVAFNPDFMPPSSRAVPGAWGFKAMEFAGTKSYFDLLDSRPFPSTVSVHGNYISVTKPFSVTENMTVKDGS